MWSTSNRTVVQVDMLNDATRNCTGRCAEQARRAFEKAAASATPPGQDMADLNKRFRLLREVSSTNRHQEAEITLEHALALYEAAFGQEDPAVAHIMLALSDLYLEHGNAEAAQYMRNWAHDILERPKDEPTHEFFHLFGIKGQEQGNANNSTNPS